MRYNPATDRARYTMDEIAEQCRAAVMKAKAQEQREFEQAIDEIVDLLLPC